MTPVLSAKGVTVLMTSELEERFQESRFSPYGRAILVDVVVMQRYVGAKSELRTVISIIKLRGSRHSRQIRSVEIGDGEIGTCPTSFDGVLLGIHRQARPPLPTAYCAVTAPSGKTAARPPA